MNCMYFIYGLKGIQSSLSSGITTLSDISSVSFTTRTNEGQNKKGVPYNRILFSLSTNFMHNMLYKKNMVGHSQDRVKPHTLYY